MKIDEITSLLNEWARGDEAALNRLLPAVHGELRRVAQAYLRGERDVETLQPTALVNEAVIRLLNGVRPEGWESRGQLIGVMAHIMREVLVDTARRHQAAKRPKRADSVNLDLVEISVDDAGILIIHDALERLAKVHERQARVVELKYFGGLTIDEIALLTNSTESTVTRDWRLARAWLQRNISDEHT